LTVESVVVSVGQLSDYKSVAPLAQFFRPFAPVAYILAFILVGSFFSAMAVKLRLTRSADVKRRLRLLYWGATCAFSPVLFLTIYARVVGKTIDEVFPQWFVFLLVSFLVLFPLTLAYVIVVQKAMGVGVVVRQGLQYALAKNGM